MISQWYLVYSWISNRISHWHRDLLAPLTQSWSLKILYSLGLYCNICIKLPNCPQLARRVSVSTVYCLITNDRETHFIQRRTYWIKRFKLSIFTQQLSCNIRATIASTLRGIRVTIASEMYIRQKGYGMSVKETISHPYAISAKIKSRGSHKVLNKGGTPLLVVNFKG